MVVVFLTNAIYKPTIPFLLVSLLSYNPPTPHTYYLKEKPISITQKHI